MAQALEKISKITAKGQTTVPEVVRRALGVRAGDRIVFQVRDGQVMLTRAASPDDADPALAPFLALLERDIGARPQALSPVDEDLMRRIDGLVGGLDVDLDALIEDDGESVL